MMIIKEDAMNTFSAGRNSLLLSRVALLFCKNRGYSPSLHRLTKWTVIWSCHSAGCAVDPHVETCSSPLVPRNVKDLFFFLLNIIICVLFASLTYLQCILVVFDPCLSSPLS